MIGDKKMALFDDVSLKDKLFVYEHRIDWILRSPVPHPERSKPVPVEEKEPLRVECEHFIDCLESRKPPLTDGNEGLRVLKILEACQKSLEEKGKEISLKRKDARKFFLHETS